MSSSQHSFAYGPLYQLDSSRPIDAQLKSINPGRYEFILFKNSPILYFGSHYVMIDNFDLDVNTVEIAGELIYSIQGKIIYFSLNTNSFFDAFKLTDPQVCEARKQIMCEKFNIASEVFFSLSEAKFLNKYIREFFSPDNGLCILKDSPAQAMLSLPAEFYVEDEEDFPDRAQALFFALMLNQNLVQKSRTSLQEPSSPQSHSSRSGNSFFPAGKTITPNPSSVPNLAAAGAQAVPAAAVTNEQSALSPLVQEMIDIGILYKIDTSLVIEEQINFLDPGLYSFVVLKDSPILFLNFASHNVIINNFKLDISQIEMAGELIYSPEAKIIYLNFKTGGYYKQLQQDDPEVCERLKEKMFKRFKIACEAFFSIDEVEFLKNRLDEYFDANKRIIFSKESDYCLAAAVGDDFDQLDKSFAARAKILLAQLNNSVDILEKRISKTQGPYSRRFGINQNFAAPTPEPTAAAAKPYRC